MRDTIIELKTLIDRYEERFRGLDEQTLSAKPKPQKWSKKEVIGHLIDSAHTNLRRFISGQYDDPLKTIAYDQEFWVRANDYQNLEAASVISLWRALNTQLCHVLTVMSPEAYSRQCNTSSTGIELHDLEWLAKDYVRHMKHHLNQIFPGEFDVLYISR